MDSLIPILIISVYGFGGITSLVTLVVGITIWIVVPGCRTFKNYVFLNIILSFTVFYFTTVIPTIIVTYSYRVPWTTFIFFASLYVNEFFMISTCCWLVVMSMLVYADLVAIFNTNVTRKYRKSNLFAYGVPALMVIVSVLNCLTIYYDAPGINVAKYRKVFFYETIAQDILLTIFLATNCVVYSKVIHSLRKTLPPPAMRRSADHSQKIQLATLAFVMSGLFLLVCIGLSLTTFSKNHRYTEVIIIASFAVIQTTAFNVCFLMSKENRRRWTQHSEAARRAAAGAV